MLVPLPPASEIDASVQRFRKALIGPQDVLETANDDGSSATIPLPFDFWMNGKRYTYFLANVNGWIKLGTSNSIAFSNSAYSNGISGTTALELICPMWDDLYMLGNNNDKVHYVVTGTAPTTPSRLIRT